MEIYSAVVDLHFDLPLITIYKNSEKGRTWSTYCAVKQEYVLKSFFLSGGQFPRVLARPNYNFMQKTVMNITVFFPCLMNLQR